MNLEYKSLIQAQVGTPQPWASCDVYTLLQQNSKLLISAAHLAGKANILADALFCNNSSYFLSTFPQAPHQITQIIAALTDLLMGTSCIPIHQATTCTLISAPRAVICPSHLRDYTLSIRRHSQTAAAQTQIIKSYLASICFFHISNNRGNHLIRDMHQLQYILMSCMASYLKKRREITNLDQASQ